jgi:hypothetical protein
MINRKPNPNFDFADLMSLPNKANAKPARPPRAQTHRNTARIAGRPFHYSVTPRYRLSFFAFFRLFRQFSDKFFAAIFRLTFASRPPTTRNATEIIRDRPGMDAGNMWDEPGMYAGNCREKSGTTNAGAPLPLAILVAKTPLHVPSQATLKWSCFFVTVCIPFTITTPHA